jgi:D-lactate dehydrogenase
MRIAFYNTKPFDRQAFEGAASFNRHQVRFLKPRLDRDTAELAAGSDAACLFVNDHADGPVLERLKALGVRHLALRCSGFNQVDLPVAQRLGISVVRVPAYSPYAVAEHAAGLVLMLNRKLHRAYNRVRDGNFALDGLLGFDLHGKTVGIIGTGRIGACVARIFHGFGCRLVAHDPYRNPEVEALGATYTGIDELLGQADIVSLHAPLTADNRHLINSARIARCKRGAMIVNTSRGGLIDTAAAIDGLKSGQLGGLAIDVYEGEADLFFEDRSQAIIHDDLFTRLLTFPNVVVTAHQAFFTREALGNIAEVTLSNLIQLERGEVCPNAVG